MNMNNCIIIGNLASDPSLSQTTTNKSVCRFTVAVNNGKDKDGNDRPADFITCQAWNKTAELIAKWWTKGKPIALTGAFKTDKYQDKNHSDVTHYNSYILVNTVEFIGSKSDNGNHSSTVNQSSTQQTDIANDVEVISDQDVPF